jgi:hypothetical protein
MRAGISRRLLLVTSTAIDRLSNAGETRYNWQHYIPLLQRKPDALRN